MTSHFDTLGRRMNDDLEQLIAALDGSSIAVSGAGWELLVLDSPQSRREWLLLLAVFGPLNGEVSVRVDLAFDPQRIAIAVLRCINEWLAPGGEFEPNRPLEMAARIVRASLNG